MGAGHGTIVCLHAPVALPPAGLSWRGGVSGRGDGRGGSHGCSIGAAWMRGGRRRLRLRWRWRRRWRRVFSCAVASGRWRRRRRGAFSRIIAGNEAAPCLMHQALQLVPQARQTRRRRARRARRYSSTTDGGREKQRVQLHRRIRPEEPGASPSPRVAGRVRPEPLARVVHEGSLAVFCHTRVRRRHPRRFRLASREQSKDERNGGNVGCLMCVLDTTTPQL